VTIHISAPYYRIESRRVYGPVVDRKGNREREARCREVMGREAWAAITNRKWPTRAAAEKVRATLPAELLPIVEVAELMGLSL
jgi:hypothetical protein